MKQDQHMTKSHTSRAIVFLDFDGTISCRDAVDYILETYAEPRWLEFEAKWRDGRIGSRECLRAQMSLVSATRDELDALLGDIDVDEGFAPLLEMCAAQQVPVHIVSDGFDYCIQRILSRIDTEPEKGLSVGRVCASHLEHKGNRWRTAFPFFEQTCAHGCATCKPAVMRLLNSANLPTVFVGDGLSDRYAAQTADQVFAKGKLAAYCGEQSIDHTSFQNLEEVAAHLERWLTSSRFQMAEEMVRASA
jgi:2-hydroxy-3-keto-5-methylthiopentenyl-1-phosphate phosphatase